MIARRAVEPRGHDRGEADRAGADDGDDVAGLDRPLRTPISKPVGRMSESITAASSLTPSGSLCREFSANGHAHVLGLGAVDEVAEDPADARGALVVEAVRGQAAGGSRRRRRTS